MAKTEVAVIELRHPLGRGRSEEARDVRAYYEHLGYMLHASRTEGAVEWLEMRKTLDYNRRERRTARKSGQELRVNEFKGILPAGYVPIPENDPRLQVPPPAEGV